MFSLPKLNYELNALEPVISQELLRTHYLKHHQAYINNLNALLEKYQEAERKNDLSLMTDLMPSIRFNAGGHLNHSFFWESLFPSAAQGKIITKIEDDFGSFVIFKEKFSKMAADIKGSGWAWLLYNVDTKNLQIASTSNHDRCEANLKPLMVIDAWEHAYYLQYKNLKMDFIKEIWKILNWQKINERYLTCI
jgi:superoxide dismutase, Fe-Mn family